MKLHILRVEDCPNAAVLTERLTAAAALDGRDDVEIVQLQVDSTAAAEALGMRGSPTLLVDGTDPFADPDQPASLSCRLYRDDTGRPDRAPTVAQLRRVLSTPTSPATRPSTLLADSCGCAQPLTPTDRVAHQAVLRGFAATGKPPDSAALDRIADRAALERLRAMDVIQLDPTGRITVAYPFSVTPTAHRVRISGGPEVYAMCAVDALGVPWMLGADVVISSVDPVSAEPVTVAVEHGRFTWRPPTAVVVVSARAACSPTASCRCSDVNFFAGRNSAQAWLDANPAVSGEIVPPAEAEQLGRHIFGPLLDADQPVELGDQLGPQPAVPRPQRGW